MNESPLGPSALSLLPGSFPDRWIHGPSSPAGPPDPPLQVHRYDPATYILRESKGVSFEAPFLYLFFGADRAILFDTGTAADGRRFPLRSTVDALVNDWLVRNPREGYELVVAHTHGHSDHVSGDPQFRGRPLTRIVGRTAEEVHRFFGFSGPTAGPRAFELGGRSLLIFPIPGHHSASIAIYDARTGFLLTGDALLPGRLYVFDMESYRASVDRLVQFAQTHPVRFLMGGHVEMSREHGRDFPLGALYQPGEHPLELAPERLLPLRDALSSVASTRGIHRFDEFVLYNGVGTLTVLSEFRRGRRYNRAWRKGRLSAPETARAPREPPSR